MDDKEFNDIFWNNFKAKLKTTGLSQKDFCTMAGLNFRTMQNQMFRSQSPSLQSAYIMASKLNLKIDDLLQSDLLAAKTTTARDDQIQQMNQLLDQVKDKLLQMLD